jgi:hypothetical protein
LELEMKSGSFTSMEMVEDEQALALYIVQQNQLAREDTSPDSLDHVESFHPVAMVRQHCKQRVALR